MKPSILVALAGSLVAISLGAQTATPAAWSAEQMQRVLERTARTRLRRADAASISRDLAVLAEYPSLDTLHPGLRSKLARLGRAPNRRTLYGLPYSVAYADQMIRSHTLLHEAATAVEGDDVEFARYLRNRGRDLLTDDYESGDASWLKGHFKHLNAQIGAYETYDDELFGTRAFYGLSLLSTRVDESAALRRALQGIQAPSGTKWP